MELTEQQQRFFHTFGYLKMPQMLAPDEVAWVTDEFEWAIQNQGGGKKHDGSQRTMFGGPIEHRAKACTLLDHPRVKALIGGLIGHDFNYCGGDGNYYSGDTGWHPDGNWGQLFAVKVAFYLDPLTKDTGCLRVIPGSHRPEHFVRAQDVNPAKTQELFGLHPKDFPGNVPVEITPGDVVIFNHDTWHAAFGGGQWRRMFTMNCTRRAHSDADLKLLRDYLKVHSAGGYNVRTGAGMYHPTMLESAGLDRLRHLEQPRDIHDELFPHLAAGAVAGG